MELTNSKRLLYTATYVATRLTESDRRHLAGQPGGALRKANLIGALGLDSADIAALRQRVDGAEGAEIKRVFRVASALVTDPTSQLEHARQLATVSAEALLSFAELVREVKGPSPAIALATQLFDFGQQVSPIGRLHLERLENYPIGVERGEMVFTVPMAPGETITISHKEWSLSSREFEEIVQDQFETYSERGVAEKTDTSMSTENEARHASAINFGATLSGGYGGVSLTTTFGLTSSNEERESLKESMQRNREVTEKASARTRKEHKVSVKLETKSGAEDSSFRTISNPSPDAVRIDFFRMMRKWRTDQYRYGLRMTYDIAIPTPAVRLWARWARIAELERLIATGFAFMRPDGSGPLNSADITEAATELNWSKLADRYQASVEPPPPAVLPIPVLDKLVTTGDPGKEIFEFVPPAGYTVDEIVDARISYWGGGEPLLNISDPSWQSQPPLSKHPGSGPGDGWYETKIHAFGSPLKREITVLCGAGTILTVSMQATARRTSEAFDSWRRRTWTALHDAAVARHNEAISRLQDERDKLWRQLAGKDTLSLRRLEREELLRLILLWLIGPAGWYSNAPAVVEQAVQQLLSNEQHLLAGAAPPPGGSPTFSGVGLGAWSQALGFGELVKFLMQAVEWENLLYFLYPYFWGSEHQGRDRLLFEHPDPEHQNFLRAGYARVVLTVRPGFEEDLLRLIETGSLTGPYNSPYMPIAQEIANRARTNYASVPPANPERHARPLLYPQQRHTWDIMQQVISALETYAAAHSGAYPATLADLPGGAPPTDAWGNDLVYVVPGSGNEYDLISYGADGKEGGDDLAADISAAAGASLVASWFDYTPTSGLDIQVDTKPGDFA